MLARKALQWKDTEHGASGTDIKDFRDPDKDVCLESMFREACYHLPRHTFTSKKTMAFHTSTSKVGISNISLALRITR